MKSNTMIGILGPTASGKTKLAVDIASELNAEIISLDSRQIYKELNLGVGKDLLEYQRNGKQIPYHLISQISLHDQYNVSRFKKDFKIIYDELQTQHKKIICCGGTGLYFDVLLNPREFTEIPINPTLRKELESFSLKELQEKIESYKLDHSFDTSTKKRSIRALEIILSDEFSTTIPTSQAEYKMDLYGIKIEKKELNRLIDLRLQSRLDQGLIEEVEELLNQGFTYERLVYLGLEYKFVCMFLQSKINRAELFEQLRIAIHQYSKRQMTFFRKLEREGHVITWSSAEKLKEIIVEKYL